jgi:hypothetical protein
MECIIVKSNSIFLLYEYIFIMKKMKVFTTSYSHVCFLIIVFILMLTRNFPLNNYILIECILKILNIYEWYTELVGVEF